MLSPVSPRLPEPALAAAVLRPLRPHSASAKVVVVEAGERRHGWAWAWVGLVRRVLRSRRLPEARLAAAGAAGGWAGAAIRAAAAVGAQAAVAPRPAVVLL